MPRILAYVFLQVAAMERVEALEDEVGRLNELMQELEVDSMAKQVHLVTILTLIITNLTSCD